MNITEVIMGSSISAVSWLLQVIIIALACILVVLMCVRIIRGGSIKKHKKHIEVKNLGHEIESYSMQVKKSIYGKKQFASLEKKLSKKRKDYENKHTHGPLAFVVDFYGDIKASQVETLRDEVSTILETADAKKDEVVVRVESRGGAVPGYGLAASQLKRIRDRKIPLTVCIDKVAASGGYMMACTANTIIAAPFAIVGSIGVISMVPNLHRFLKSKNIDYEELTAGEYKRTVSLFGEISKHGREKHIKDLEDMHHLFKSHVQKNRPSLDIDKVSTGEYWYGLRAKELNLIDKILSSDDYIGQLIKGGKKVYKVKLSLQKSLSEKLGEKLGESSVFQKMFSFGNKMPEDFSSKHPEHFI